jgi:hypothetical protein
VQLEAEEHDTSFRTLKVALAGLGVRCSIQELPFQRSASVTSLPALLV